MPATVFIFFHFSYLSYKTVAMLYIGASLMTQMIKESTCKVGDPGSILWLGRSPGEGNGNPLQYSCLENPMNERAWRATVHGGHRVRHD